MSLFLSLTKRNLLIFFRNRLTVFFSLLGSIIILVLYLLFLKSMYVDQINEAIKSMNGLITGELVDAFINSWLLSGIIAASCITVSLNSLSVMVSDKEFKIDYDYNASPIKNSVIFLSYFVSAAISALIIVSIVLAAGLIYFLLAGTFYLSLVDVIMAFLITILGTLSATIIMMVLASVFKKSSVLGAFGGIISAVIGFLIGAYMPISQFDKGVQLVGNALPGSHIAGLLRNVLMSPVLNDMNTALNGIDGGQFIISMKETFAFDLYFFGQNIGTSTMLIYVILSTIAFIIIMLFVFKKTSKRK